MRPNRHTIGLVGVLLAMWYAGASQNNAAAYLLGFLTLSVAAVSALHAWANLRGLQLVAEPIPPVFENEPVVVGVMPRSREGHRHVGILIAAEGNGTPVLLEQISDQGASRVELLATPRARGHYRTLNLFVASTYPFGFFTARRVVQLTQPFHVYPRPAGSVPLPSDLVQSRDAQSGLQTEGDDFAGVRDWQPGDSMRHVDWKAVARGQRLMVKQWSGNTRDPLTFSWDSLPEMPAEDRLRQLARWIVQAERIDSPYRLELPGHTTTFSRGEGHMHHCLRALAEYAVPVASDQSHVPG